MRTAGFGAHTVVIKRLQKQRNTEIQMIIVSQNLWTVELLAEITLQKDQLEKF